jgi:polar amino acid transport system substrate-binding protein
LNDLGPDRADLGAAVGLLLCLTVAACSPGADGPDDESFTLVTPGTLTACADAPVEPFVFEEARAETGYDGFDIAVLDEIADRLGLVLAVERAPFEAIVAGGPLIDGICDVAASAISSKGDWSNRLEFSDPYYTRQLSLLVAVDAGIADPADTTEQRIGVRTGSAGEAHVGARLPEAESVSFSTSADLLAALDHGEIAGVLQDLAANAVVARDREDLEVVATFDVDDEYVFAVAASREDGFLEGLDQQLAALRADGTYDRLHVQYFEVDPDRSG